LGLIASLLVATVVVGIIVGTDGDIDL